MSLAREQSTCASPESATDKLRGAIRLASVAIGIHLFASGCGIVIDTERTQCEAPSDCAEALGGGAIDYTCDQNLCNTRVDCRNNTECTVAGKSICQAGQCVECVVSADCGTTTATCVDNVCQDPVWGCIDEPDTRPAPSISTVSIKIPAIDPILQTGVPGTTAKACLSPVVDSECKTPTSTMFEYSDMTGDTIIRGIGSGQLYRIRWAPPEASGMLPLDYVTNRTAREGDTVPAIVFTPAAIFSQLGEALGYKNADPSKASVQVRAFNCMGELAEGVTLVVTGGNQGPDMQVIYLSESMNPDQSLTATSKRGTAGILNGPTTLARYSIVAGKRTVMAAQATLTGYRATVMDIFPRVFTQ